MILQPGQGLGGPATQLVALGLGSLTPSDGVIVGQVTVQPGWQIIAIPIVTGQWNGSTTVDDGVTPANVANYIVQQLEDKYGAGVVEVCNAYLGGVGSFYNYVPGTTPQGSIHNFQMAYEDPVASTNWEITGFWINSLHGSNMILDYGVTP